MTRKMRPDSETKTYRVVISVVVQFEAGVYDLLAVDFADAKKYAEYRATSERYRVRMAMDAQFEKEYSKLPRLRLVAKKDYKVTSRVSVTAAPLSTITGDTKGHPMTTTYGPWQLITDNKPPAITKCADVGTMRGFPAARIERTKTGVYDWYIKRPEDHSCFRGVTATLTEAMAAADAALASITETTP